MPTVSIIITVYNGAKYLNECLESVLSQTLSNIEVICVDDASTDDTPRILKDYQDKITILTNDVNCMAGESRNRGFHAATGEYVIFLDADDVFEPDMLEKAYNRASSCNADICVFMEDLFTDNVKKCNNYHYAETLMESLGKKDFFSPSEVSDMLFSLWNGWAWDKLIRREFILETGLRFQNLQSSNDGFFVHAAMATAHRISLLNEVLVHHRIGDGSSVSNTRDRAWESCLIYLKELKRYLVQKELYPTFERSYINWTSDFLYWNYQTLNNVSREQLTEAIRRFFLDDLDIEQYGREYFYNLFLWRFVDCIVNHEENKILLTEEEKFWKTYQMHSDKLETLHKYISERHWKAAIWGAGIRGQAFAEIYGEQWTELCFIYDMDKSKHGIELCLGLIIQGFDKQQIDKADCILVLNPTHLLSVHELLHGENIVLFDINTYLTLPCEIDACMMKCK